MKIMGELTELIKHWLLLIVDPRTSLNSAGWVLAANEQWRTERVSQG